MAQERVTEVLADLRDGATDAGEELLHLVYGELRRIAGSQMRAENPGHTLSPTALVHEAYVRLLGDGSTDWESRAHFFGAAARAMRRILVDWARKRGAQKRGGDLARITLDESEHSDGRAWEEIATVHDALEKLDEVDADSARVVELRFFGGLEFDEIAKTTGVSSATVYRTWNLARAWLFREIGS